MLLTCFEIILGRIDAMHLFRSHYRVPFNRHFDLKKTYKSYSDNLYAIDFGYTLSNQKYFRLKTSRI